MNPQFRVGSGDVMRLLAFSDLHGEDEFLDRLRQHLFKHKYDGFLIAGDIEYYEYCEELLEILEGENVFVVPGNMDDERIRRLLEERDVSVEGRIKRLSGWKVTGVGGSLISPFHTPYQHDEEWFKMMLDKVKDEVDEKTILITHTPPYGVFDVPESLPNLHVGSKEVLKFIQETQPGVNVCGHIHERQGRTSIGRTEVVKLPPAKSMMVAILELGERLTDVSFTVLR